MIHLQLLYHYFTTLTTLFFFFFLKRSTIRSVGPTCKKTNPTISLKFFFEVVQQSFLQYLWFTYLPCNVISYIHACVYVYIYIYIFVSMRFKPANSYVTNLFINNGGKGGLNSFLPVLSPS
jgi:hypothetical protein